MDVSRMVESLKELNRNHSKIFCSPDAQMERKFYRTNHRTHIIATQCMDGRVNLAGATQTPSGIIRSLRNLGGQFDLGWPYLGEVFGEEVGYAVNCGHKILVLVNYHYSEGDKHRGCAGCSYDYEKSVRSADMFKNQIERVYGFNHQVVCPVLCGLETDRDALILHGDHGEIIDVSALDAGIDIGRTLKKMFKKMPDDILVDLESLIRGNISHCAEIKRKRRPIVELQHKEWIVGIGRGFEFLHKPNMALIVGPYYPNLKDPIGKAIGIIRSNMDSGRIADDGFVLLSSAVHRSDAGPRIARARERAIFLNSLAQEVIKDDYPEMEKVMQVMTITTNLDTREFKEIRQ